MDPHFLALLRARFVRPENISLRPVFLAVWLAAGAVFPARATDLIQAWQGAQNHDLDFLAAQSAHDAGLTQRAQSSALWRPTVQASATAGRMSSDTQTQGAQFSAPALAGGSAINGANFNTSINNGTLDRWSVTARQPLLNGERLAQSRQLDTKAQMADLQWQQARQNLMIQTVQRYFDVALAQEALRVARQQEQSVQKALDEIKRRYQLGDAPITDTHEATARWEAIRAQVLAAETEVQLKQAALSDATGINPEQLVVLEPLAGTLPRNGQTLTQWEEAVAAGNPQMQLQRLQVVLAHEEAARYSALSSPSVDLVGEMTRDHLSGSGEYGAAANNLHTALVGVQLNIPLYSGGMRSARHEETLHLADKAAEDAARVQQQVALQTRAAWLGLSTGHARVAALEAALRATEKRLSATRLGHEVGDRSTLDLLNAESDAANARLAWLQARVALIMNRLQLSDLAGHLEQAQLDEINALLEPSANPNNSPTGGK